MTDRKQLERYLLGGMTEDERAALEREYFNDRSLFEEVVRVENELVDEYARGLLPPPTRERFEQNYLSHPARRERARFAEALAVQIDRTNEVAAGARARARPPWLSWLAAWRGPRLIWAMTAALLLVASIAALFVFRGRQAPETSVAEVGSPARERRASESPPQPTPGQTPQVELPAEATNARAEQPPAPPAPPTATKATPAFVTLTLTVAGTRGSGEGPATLVIPARTEHVRLRLNMRESDYARYSVVLRAAGGGEIFERGQLVPRSTRFGAGLALDVPARILPAGDYVLTLKGVGETGEVEEVSKSLIRVERR
jgi:hypothetical protein